MDAYSNENSYDDGRDDPIKEILDIDSQILPIRKVYFYLRNLNYFDGKVGIDIIAGDKNVIDSTIDLMKRIADPKKITDLYRLFKEVKGLKNGCCLIVNNTQRGEE